MVASASRIVVQVNPETRKLMVDKARRLGISVPELMRRGALAYERETAEDELGALADRAKDAAERAGASIDEALAFIEASNRRIVAIEGLGTALGSRSR